MANTTELALALLVSGGTSLSTPVNAAISALDTGIGLQATDRRENRVLVGLDLAAGDGLSLNVNLQGHGANAYIWQRGQRYTISAGTSVTVPAGTTSFVFYDNDRSGNPFYAQISSIPAGTADVLVGVAVASASAITSAYTNVFCADTWGQRRNNSGMTAQFGMVAVLDTADPEGYVLGAQANLARACGVVTAPTVNGNHGPVQYAGRGWMLVTGTVAVGDLLGTSHLLGVGTTLAAPNAGAVIAKAEASVTAGAGTALIPVLLGAGSGGGAPVAADTVTSEVTFGATPSAGTASTFSRGDHTHGSVNHDSITSLTGSLGTGQHGNLADGDHLNLLTGTARTIWRQAGVDKGSRRALNVLAGTGVVATMTDDAGNEEVELTYNIDQNSSYAYASLGWVLDGGGVAIANGQKGHMEIPFNGTIKRFTALGDQAGSLSFELKKSPYAGFPIGTSITGAGMPSMSGVQKYQDSVLSGWTTTVAAGDVLYLSTHNGTTITRCTVSLAIQKGN